MFVQSAAAYAKRKKKEEFLCVVVMVVESPSLGTCFFFVSLAWAELSWSERDGTDACMHAHTT